jgi:hypothetical protein
MPPPMYITFSVSWFKSLLEHERRCLSGRYRTQPQSTGPKRLVKTQPEFKRSMMIYIPSFSAGTPSLRPRRKDRLAA